MNNFTPRAQQVLQLARKEADRFNHNYVGTEHLLLGLIKLGQGVAVNVLQKMGLDLETVRMEVEKQVGSGPETKIVGNIPYTPRVKKVLALAGKEAKTLNHSYVGTEHILLGLLREGEGVAARVLKSLEIDIERTRNEILKELDPNFTPSEAEEGEPTSKKDVKTPALRAFGRDLTELAKKGELDPVIGRRNEIERRQNRDRGRSGAGDCERKRPRTVARQARGHARSGINGRGYKIPRSVRRAHQSGDG